jgi:hypothetical protein
MKRGWEYMEMIIPPDEKEDLSANHDQKRTIWTNDDKVELLKLRLQGLIFEEIGKKINRTKHSSRSEYGRIRRGETDVIVSLKYLPELRKVLPIKKAGSLVIYGDNIVGAKHLPHKR